MAGWDDLVLAGQPRLINYPFETTEGADWSFKVGPFTDANRDPVDLSAVPFECKVLIEVEGAEVATWAVTGDADGYVSGTLAKASTADLAASSDPRRCVWYCYGTDGERVYFWGPTNSVFIIGQGA